MNEKNMQNFNSTTQKLLIYTTIIKRNRVRNTAEPSTVVLTKVLFVPLQTRATPLSEAKLKKSGQVTPNYISYRPVKAPSNSVLPEIS